jgi:hypothetical protein
MDQTNLSGYFEEDAEGLYIASHITILAGSLGAVTFSDGTSSANTFMTNVNGLTENSNFLKSASIKSTS